MAITVQRNFPAITRAVKWTRRDWEDIGYAIVLRIQKRSARGVDANGQAFAPYSKGYAKRRLDEGFAPQPVNLRLSGEMLNGMLVQATDRGVTVTFRE